MNEIDTDIISLFLRKRIIRMKFTTPIEISSKAYPKIDYSHSLMSLGSCFSEHIGAKLTDSKFKCLVNPFGVLYNPSSINIALQELMEGKMYSEDDLFFDQDEWHSWMHHGSFSNSDKRIVLDKINAQLELGHSYLDELDYLLLTFGSSWVYKQKESNGIVSNCHKVKSSKFIRERLSVAEILSSYKRTFTDLFAKYPHLKIVLSVSPIRHVRDGLHENQKSKAILLLAIEELENLFPGQVFYFPSYEIVLDELRDYRFFTEDMVHPSAVAVNYIWEIFQEVFFDKSTMKTLNEYFKIQKGLQHRALRPELKSHHEFLEHLIYQMEQISIKNAKLDFRKEIDICLTQLKKYRNY